MPGRQTTKPTPRMRSAQATVPGQHLAQLAQRVSDVLNDVTHRNPHRYSVLNACIGSTPAARQAGTRPDAKTVSSKTIAAAQ